MYMYTCMYIYMYYKFTRIIKLTFDLSGIDVLRTGSSKISSYGSEPQMWRVRNHTYTCIYMYMYMYMYIHVYVLVGEMPPQK